ncbi:MAG: YraN family protein [Roseburia sp.]|nr:YraN family protein [Roseburia sp.]
MNKRRKGAQWEEKAASYLTDMGYHILEMNYRCRLGEIDIIAKESGYYVFAEVKYRSSNEYGSPLEAVTPAKQQRIRRVALVYLLEHGISMYVNCRFDVVGILNGEITLIQDAF